MITPVDYKMVCEWWAARGFPVLPKATLPSTSFTVYFEDKPIIATFLYLPRDKVNVAWMEWTVANPHTTLEERSLGFAELVRYVEGVCKEQGINMIFTNTPHKRFGEKLEANGFMPQENGMNYIKAVL